jgi:hypothetical protein
MGLEAAVSLGAAWRAYSPALLAFGGDSAIELVSALVVYWRFRFHSTEMKAEKLATRIAGGLLFGLSAYLLLASGAALFGKREARPKAASWRRAGGDAGYAAAGGAQAALYVCAPFLASAAEHPTRRPTLPELKSRV